MENMPEVDILIVGAGPTGLSAAIEASRHGLSFRIVDRKEKRSQFSKALVVHARTMEVFEDLGISAEVLQRGVEFQALNIAHGPNITPIRVDLIHREWGDTRYPFWLTIPQYDTEAIMEERLESLGHKVEWSTELVDLEDLGESTKAVLQKASGEKEEIHSKWTLGCDGGRSPTRGFANLTMPKEECGATFVLCDAHTTSDLIQDQGHAFFSTEGLLLIVPMPEDGLFRVIAHVFEAPPEGAIDDPAWWDALIKRRSGHDYGAHNLDWTSCFDLHQGVATKYRSGQIFLLGDAAHIHSPVGGQGLNTGVQDAYNLVWKLALEKENGELAGLLDSYEIERRPIAIGMVEGTGKATSVLTTQNTIKRMIIGRGARIAMRLDFVRNRLGRPIGMLDLSYEKSPILSPKRGRGIGPGDRLANPEISAEKRLHDLLEGEGHILIGTKRDESSKLNQIVLGSEALPDPNGEIAKALHLDSGTQLLVRPDRVIAAVIKQGENMTSPYLDAIQNP